MAAHASVHSPSAFQSFRVAPSTAKPPPERRRLRSHDTENALQLQLAAVRAAHDVDVVVIADLDGAPVASAGDEAEAIALGAFAASLAKDSPVIRSVVTRTGFVIVERLDVGVRSFVMAAKTAFGTPDAAAIARALAGAVRILADGLQVSDAAPLPLVELDGWGDWPERVEDMERILRASVSMRRR